MIKIRFKSMLIVAVMAFQTTVNAATVSIEDATQRMVRERQRL